MEEGIFGNQNISCLFPEILTMIFQYLNVRDRGRVAQVSVKWRDAAYSRIVWKNVIAKLHLRKSTQHHLFPSLVKRGIVRIQVLSFKKGLRELVYGLPNLEILDLSGCFNVTDNNLNVALTSCLPSLAHLNLSLCKSVTDTSLARISKLLPNLICLDLAGCSRITASGLVYIGWGLPKMKRLNLRSCTQVSDRGIGNICGHNLQVTGAEGNLELEELILQDSQTITDQALKLISNNLSFLRILNLSFCGRITDSGLRFLAKMSTLRELNVRMCEDISDIGIGYLAEGGSRVTHLDLSFCSRVTDDSLIHISQGLFQLQNLSLCNCNVSDEGISKMVRTCHEIDTLNLGQCRMLTNQSIETIAQHLKRIKEIDLYGCPRITPSALQRLWQLSSMKVLNVCL